MLNCSNEFFLNDIFNIDKIIRAKQARICSIKFLSEFNNIDMGLYFAPLPNRDKINLKFVDRNTEDLHNQINEFRINLIKLVCLENLHELYQNGEIKIEENTNFRKEKWN